MSRRGLLWACLPLAALTLGCEPPPDVEPLACRNPEPGVAEIGIGDLNTGFISLEDGDDLPLIFGPQGMHMVVLSARVEDLEVGSVGGSGTEIAAALRQDGEVVGGVSQEMTPTSDSGGVVEFLGVRAIITVAEVEDIANQYADVEITVTDGCGRALTDSRELFLLM